MEIIEWDRLTYDPRQTHYDSDMQSEMAAKCSFDVAVALCDVLYQWRGVGVAGLTCYPAEGCRCYPNNCERLCYGNACRAVVGNMLANL